MALAGCGAPVLTPDELNASYEEALTHTAALAVEFPAGAGQPGGSLGSIRDLFTVVEPEVIRARTLEVYAPDAYLNDNLVALRGAEAIGGYFALTARRISALRLTMLDVAHSGPDYFVRWRMVVEAPAIRGGQPLVSYGVTHFRFASDGRILLHKDFWDAGTGLYEHLPVVGTALRRVRAAVESE
jgi:hypothetical protein